MQRMTSRYRSKASIHYTESYCGYFKQTTLRQKGPGYWNTRAQNAFENKTSQLPCRSRLISELAPFFIELRAERSSASGCLLVFLDSGTVCEHTFGLVTPRCPWRLGEVDRSLLHPGKAGLSRSESLLSGPCPSERALLALLRVSAHVTLERRRSV